MQLFLTRDLERVIRAHPRPYGRVLCDSNQAGTLLGRAVMGEGAPGESVEYPELAVEGDPHGRATLSFIRAEPPQGAGPWAFAPGTLREDTELAARILNQARRLPHLPADYQPYAAELLLRNRRILVVGDSRVVLLRRRKILYPPGISWYPVPAMNLPASLTDVGVNPHLSGRSALLVGLGSLGSYCAELLAAAGMERLVLVDPDPLELRNLRRHLCGVEHIGRFKTEAVADELRRRGYEVDLELVNSRVQVEEADELRARAAECDVLLCAADSTAARQFVNHCAVSYGKPAVIANIQLRPQPLGEIAVVSPTAGGCFNCWRLELEKSGLLVRNSYHDPLDYPGSSPQTPSGLPMYQIAIVASAASDFVGAALSGGEFTSRTWLMALDVKVPDFDDLEVRQGRIEELNRDPTCEVCAKL